MPQQRLIEILKCSLNQELELLDALSDEQYAAPGQGPFKSSIGQHIRHNLDHFEALFDGLPAKRVDYESRGRSELVSESTDFAAGRIQQYIGQLDQLDEFDPALLLVRKEDGLPEEHMDWLSSSLARELQFLLGHTVHHHAIICFMLSGFGIRQPEGFGVAPSTQRYEARVQASS